jgi:hypothetical protein
LVPEEVSPKKLKTSEDLSNEIGYDVDIDNHEVGVDMDINFITRLVPDEVSPRKLKKNRRT